MSIKGYGRTEKWRRGSMALAAMAGGLIGIAAGVVTGELPAAAGPPPIGYVVDHATDRVIPFNTLTNGRMAAIPVGANPIAIAITPNGTTAYVANTGSSDTVTPITTATNDAGTPIPVGATPYEIAIAPNGVTAYVITRDGSVGSITPINVATNTTGTPIPVGTNPDAIAITPNGATAYVADGVSDTVTPINLATKTTGTPIPVGNGPGTIAITPSGATAYVVNGNSDTITPITTATNSAGTPIPVGSGPDGIAITPNGATAYVTNGAADTVTPITIATNTAGTPIPTPTGAWPAGIAISPNGSTAYVVNTPKSIGGGGSLTPIDTTSNTAGPQIVSSRKSGSIAIAITPDQAPVAHFTVTPAQAHSASAFDASTSTAPGAKITSYAWNFGDGRTATTGGPKVNHVYAAAGSYTATLTLTDADGTSTTQVFTGQTMSLNGGPGAQTSHPVVVPAPPVPSITSISPTSGPTSGGTGVTITGSGFTGATKVAFSSVLASSYNVVSDTKITAVSPPQAPGTYNVRVATPTGGISPVVTADRFTYQATG